MASKQKRRCQKRRKQDRTLQPAQKAFPSLQELIELFRSESDPVIVTQLQYLIMGGTL